MDCRYIAEKTDLCEYDTRNLREQNSKNTFRSIECRFVSIQLLLLLLLLLFSLEVDGIRRSENEFQSSSELSAMSEDESYWFCLAIHNVHGKNMAHCNSNSQQLGSDGAWAPLNMCESFVEISIIKQCQPAFVQYGSEVVWTYESFICEVLIIIIIRLVVGCVRLQEWKFCEISGSRSPAPAATVAVKIIKEIWRFVKRLNRLLQNSRKCFTLLPVMNGKNSRLQTTCRLIKGTGWTATTLVRHIPFTFNERERERERSCYGWNAVCGFTFVISIVAMTVCIGFFCPDILLLAELESHLRLAFFFVVVVVYSADPLGSTYSVAWHKIINRFLYSSQLYEKGKWVCPILVSGLWTPR